MEKIPIAQVVSVGGSPSAPTPSSAAALPTLQNEGGAKEFLSARRWPDSLQDAFIQNVSRTPLRFFICDDSGSMQSSDGQMLAQANGATKLVSCSRWAELTEALKFHVGFAQAALAPSEFRLLNAVLPVRVGFQPNETQSVELLMQAFAQGPSGGTPLCQHIREVTREIQEVEHSLRAAGQKACVVIATDGESSDGNVADALRPLKNLPCWVILRLCTDEDKIVQYWNNIDAELELNMDVLDDLCSEAMEIRKFNPWLSYAEPLHRMREFGVSLKEIDLLDEARLSKEHLKKICRFIYGSKVDNLPHPEADWKGFVNGIEVLNRSGFKVFSPGDRKVRDWVDVATLKRSFATGACVVM